MSSSRPQNVGILGLEVYFPSQYVKQEDLEKHDGVAAGKYTIGLGQTQMAFVDDLEDTNSMALTVLSSLIKKYNIETSKIGRLEVGTETLLDKSKSVKTVLMQLFGDNTDVEGIDTVNACYGGTNAVFNTINWIESSSWDGRNAIVVAVDIALYAKGNARPTGGAGAVAMLIGPDAPIVFDPVHGSHIQHAYDFYKPDFTSEYPYVDGQYSLTCYTEALDKCYQTYNKKAAGRINFSEQGLDRFDYSVFHSPTCKLVSKCYARLLYNDFLANPEKFKDSVPEEIKNLDYRSSLTDKSVEKLFMGLVKQKSKERLTPSQMVPTNVGNMYAASVYSSFSSLIGNVPPSELKGKRVSFFSYGSGLASSFFSVQIRGDVTDIQNKLSISQRLNSRKASSPLEYEAAIELREKAYLHKGFKPKGDISALAPGTYYLTEIDEKFRRTYAVKN